MTFTEHKSRKSKKQHDAKKKIKHPRKPKKPKNPSTPVVDTENKTGGLQKEVEDVVTEVKNPDILLHDKQKTKEIQETADEEGDTIDVGGIDKDIKGKKDKPPQADLKPRTDDVFGFL